MQEFEKSEELTAHIKRMASTGTTGSIWVWSEFLDVLNKELETLRTENAKLIAEREATMKQEPLGFVQSYVVDTGLNGFTATLNPVREGKYTVPVFPLHPLPAQQEPVYQYHNSGNSWCDCNKNVYDAMKDEYRRIVYASPPAQQIPEGYAESEFEKYFEQIGEDAWEDHPVSQVFIDGFNCAAKLLSASQKGDVCA